MNKTSLFLASILCGLLALPAMASAKPAIDTSGAAELKKLVQDDLQKYVDLSLKTNQKLVVGDVDVAPKKDFYEVKISGLSVLLTLQRKLDIGTVVVNAAPAPKKGEWVFSMALPPSMATYDGKGRILSEVSARKQRIVGVWTPAAERPVKFDVSAQDVLVKAYGLTNMTIAVGALKGSVDFKDNGAGTWSSLDSNLHITDVAMNKVSVQQGTMEIPGTPFGITLDKISFLSTQRDTGQEKIQTLLKTNASGIKVAFAPPSVKGLIPSNVDIDVNISDLPLKKVMEILSALNTGPVCTPLDPAHALACSPPPTEEELKKISASVSKILEENGTTVSIQNTSMKSPDLETTLTGKFNAKSDTAIGAAGKMTISIKGVVEMMAKLQELAKTPDSDPLINAVLNGLTLLRMTGEQGKGSDGKTTVSYNLNMTPDGQVLLNDADIKSVFGMAQSLGGARLK